MGSRDKPFARRQESRTHPLHAYNGTKSFSHGATERLTMVIRPLSSRLQPKTESLAKVTRFAGRNGHKWASKGSRESFAVTSRQGPKTYPVREERYTKAFECRSDVAQREIIRFSSLYRASLTDNHLDRQKNRARGHNPHTLSQKVTTPPKDKTTAYVTKNCSPATR